MSVSPSLAVFHLFLRLPAPDFFDRGGIYGRSPFFSCAVFKFIFSASARLFYVYCWSHFWRVPGFSRCDPLVFLAEWHKTLITLWMRIVSVIVLPFSATFSAISLYHFSPAAAFPLVSTTTSYRSHRPAFNTRLAQVIP